MNADDADRDERPKPDPYLTDLPDEKQLASVAAAVRRFKLPGYKLLGELGRGGMGVVYEARQVGLNRRVALKMILDSDCVDAESLARFQREAEAVAKLKHPNIVQIHEIGDHDGLPFFSLELVEGGSLHSLISGQPFPSRDVAGLVETIARATQFAHEHGVIHRDLKPANILLERLTFSSVAVPGEASTKDLAQVDISTLPHRPRPVPEIAVNVRPKARPSLADFIPKVTDFGLAKQIDGGATVTRSGTVVGTPSFMPPEQAAGRASEIGPLVDVYALGAILYNLLTSRPPFLAESVIETLRLVIESDPVSPRLLNPTLDRDLETICLKCLEKDPQRRYPSAVSLADDLRRYQDGEPIHARPISAPARAWRYCKRRPLVSSLAALFILAMLLGTSVSTFFAVMSNNRATLAEDRRLKLESSNSQLTVANETAETRRIAAEEAATVAREQSQLALKSLQTVIFDIQRGLENVPGAGEVRRKLLQTALARLQEVSDQFVSRSAIDRNTMTALMDLGDVFLRIGSERPSGSNVDGPLVAARKVYQKAFDIAQKLATANPKSAQAQRDLYISYIRLGDVQLQSGQVTAAIGSFQKGLEIRQHLAGADPSDAQAQRELSVLYDRLGDVLLRSGKLTEAQESYQKGLETLQRLAAADPNDAQAQRDLFVSNVKLGDAQRQSRKPTEALGSYQRAVEISLKMATADPSDVQAQRDLSVSYVMLGIAQRQSGQTTESLGSYQKGLEISQKLAAADPSDAQAQRDLSVSYNNLGDTQRQSGKLIEALRSYQQGLEISQKLAAADPSDAQAQRDLSVSYDKLGNMQLQSGEVTAALGSYQQGLEISQKLATADPNDAQAQRDLSVSYDKLGNMQLQSGEVTAALGSYQQGLEISQKLAVADPNDAQAQRDLANSYTDLGDVLLQSEQVAEALGSYQNGLDISQKLAAADPSDAQAQNYLSASYIKLGDVLLQSGKVTKALGQYQQGLEINQKLAAADPSNAQVHFDLFASHHRIAAVHQKQKQNEQAIESYGRALKVLQSLKEQKRLPPVHEKWIGIVAQSIQHCKHAVTALGDWTMLLEQPADVLPVLLELRGTQFVQEGRASDAVQAVGKLRELGTATPGQLYNAACVYSLCAAGIKAEKDDLTGEQQKHIADAMATLREAIKAGYKDFAHMQKDPDLTVLRELPEFKALLPPTDPDEKK